MIQVFSQLLSAALGSVGFGLIFNLNRRYLPAAGVGAVSYTHLTLPTKLEV